MEFRQVVDGEPSIDLREIVATLWAGKIAILVSALLATAAFAAVAIFSTPIYRATAVLVPAANDKANLGGALGSMLGSFGGLTSLAGINLPAGDVEEALAVLRSRQFTESFIQDKNLMPVLYASLWDSQAQGWKQGEKVPTPAQAYSYFDKRIRSVTQDKKTQLITLQVEWKDRIQATEWANELVERLNDEMRRRAKLEADASLSYLEKELENTSIVATRDAINRLIEAQINQRMLASVTREYALRVVDRALPPDADDKVKPKKMLLLLAGPVVGVMLGVIGVLLWSWARAFAAGGPAQSGVDAIAR